METSDQETPKTRRSQPRTINHYLKLALVAIPCLLIRFYQLFISPLLGPHCRFNPTCSSYALQALKAHGLFKGTFLSLNRIRKCHPWHMGGDDPVPGTQPEKTTRSKQR